MDPRLPDRFEELLTRAFDGELTLAEREELGQLANVEPRLAALAELRDALRAALALPGPVDVAGEVMGVLAAEAEWSLGDALRDAVVAPVDLADAVMADVEAEWTFGDAIRAAVAAPVDVADAVMGGIEDEWTFGDAIRAAVTQPVDVADAVMAGIEDEWTFGDAIRDAVSAPVDVWAGVAEAIGEDAAAVPGWDAAPLRAAFASVPRIDVADAVMAAVEDAPAQAATKRGGMPLWASLGGPLFAFAVAAALLFSILPPAPSRTGEGALPFARVNDAQVEEISAREDVVVQVMQFEEGGPTFILVDDPSGSGVPL